MTVMMVMMGTMGIVGMRVTVVSESMVITRVRRAKQRGLRRKWDRERKVARMVVRVVVKRRL